MKIYEPAGKAREYSALALNLYNGCDHGCLYCYVPGILGAYNKDYNHENVNPQLLSGLEAAAQRVKDMGKFVTLSFTGDPYCKFNEQIKHTRQVLEILLRHQVPVKILTKGGSRCLQDIDLFKRFDYIMVGATLTFDNDHDSLKWEKGAALPSDRLHALKVLHEAGIKTWTSFEPVIYPIQSLELMSKSINFVDVYKIGKINNFEDRDKNIDWTSFLSKTLQLLRPAQKSIYIKKDLRECAPSIELYPNEINMDIDNESISVQGTLL